MMVMLDTTILIFLLKNKPPFVANTINALEKVVVLCMSFISYLELFKGAERSTRKDQVLRQFKQLTQVIAVNDDTSANLCERFARKFTQLKIAGILIGANDLWIACHALSLNASLVTYNVRNLNGLWACG